MKISPDINRILDKILENSAEILNILLNASIIFWEILSLTLIMEKYTDNLLLGGEI